VNFLRWMEFLVIGVVIVTSFTQIIIPLWRGNPVFPFFRKPQRIARNIKGAQESIESAKLAKQFKRARKKADKLEEED